MNLINKKCVENMFIIHFDTNSTDKYFVIGCFDNGGYSSFKEIGKTYPTNPTGFVVDTICNPLSAP